MAMVTVEMSRQTLVEFGVDGLRHAAVRLVTRWCARPSERKVNFDTDAPDRPQRGSRARSREAAVAVAPKSWESNFSDSNDDQTEAVEVEDPRQDALDTHAGRSKKAVQDVDIQNPEAKKRSSRCATRKEKTHERGAHLMTSRRPTMNASGH